MLNVKPGIEQSRIADPGAAVVKSHNWVAFLADRLFFNRRASMHLNLLYGYFRKVDDFIDDEQRSEAECREFLEHQKRIIRRLYTKGAVKSAHAIAPVIAYDLSRGCRLKATIFSLFETFLFDAGRRSKLVTSKELKDYSLNLGKAYARMLLHFIQARASDGEAAAFLAHACHQVHILRDFFLDQRLGYVNISKEEIRQYKIRLDSINDTNFQRWLRDRINATEGLFERSKTLLDQDRSLRVKLIGHLYSCRYELLLQQIKAAGFWLEEHYPFTLRDKVNMILQIPRVVSGIVCRRRDKC